MSFTEEIKAAEIELPFYMKIKNTVYSLEEAAKILGVEDGLNLDNPKESIISISESYMRRITSKSGESSEDMKLMSIITRGCYTELVSIEMPENNGRFELPELYLDHPDYKICPVCGGYSGFFKRNTEHIWVPCKVCEDPTSHKPTGQAFVKCRDCDGTGKYKSIFGVIEKERPCKTCKDPETERSTGYVKIRCPACKGTKKFQKEIHTKIDHMKICYTCGGVGIVAKDFDLEKEKEKHEFRLNPTKPLTAKFGDKLQAAFDEQKEIATIETKSEDDSEVKTNTYSLGKIPEEKLAETALEIDDSGSEE